MSYKVFIKVGQSQMGSTPLKTKMDVSRWIKSSPLGNWKTKVEVTNTRTKRTSRNIKVHFYNPMRWKL